MTRPDYIDDLDSWHIINVDKHHYVRPDSRLMLTVFREVAAEKDFQAQVKFLFFSFSFFFSFLVLRLSLSLCLSLMYDMLSLCRIRLITLWIE